MKCSRHYLKDVDRDKGHFRSFRLASLKHFLANEWKKANRQKRGGLVQTISFDATAAEERYRHEPAEESSAELVFDRRWAKAILDAIMPKLRTEFEQAGKADRFAELSALLSFSPDGTRLAAGSRDRAARIWEPRSLAAPYEGK